MQDCHAKISNKSWLDVTVAILCLAIVYSRKQTVIHWYDIKLRQQNGCSIKKNVVNGIGKAFCEISHSPSFEVRLWKGDS